MGRVPPRLPDDKMTAVQWVIVAAVLLVLLVPAAATGWMMAEVLFYRLPGG
jgi:hypothetical protein